MPIGATWTVAAFGHHVFLMVVRGPASTDYTGVPATIGGLAILAAGVAAGQGPGRPGYHGELRRRAPGRRRAQPQEASSTSSCIPDSMPQHRTSMSGAVS